MFLDLNTKLFWSAERDDQMTEADEGSLPQYKYIHTSVVKWKTNTGNILRWKNAIR